MDVKLKDILSRIQTSQSVQFEFNSGECCFLSYSDVLRYQEYFVIEVRGRNNLLIVTLRKEI